jgi:hypothetical protein
MYKFYVCEFTNNRYPLPDPNKVFVKFGITHHMDVMDRFNSNVDDGYAKNYKDWDIVCKFSMAFKTKAEAEALEAHWLTNVFPNPGPTKVWVERYLRVEDQNQYYDNTGITELRLLTVKQAKWVYYTCHQERMKRNQS